jgi:beta-glucosidase
MNAQTLQTEDGFRFRDLNKNGRLDPYEDPRRPVEERVEDLLSQMSLEEKAGMMFHSMLPMNPDGTLVEGESTFGPTSTSEMVASKMLNHFNVLRGADPGTMARWHNSLQRLAEGTRLGIPVTVSSDPRHAFSDNPATSFLASDFSQWPEQLGFAAAGDESLVEQFGDIARREYLAVGIRVALHPMADLATEPRWARNNGTFGEDAALSARMTAAYIRGFQGPRIGPESVACMTKHFPGGGPQKDGEDAHFPYGKEQVYPGNNFEYHLIPFEAAFEAGTAQIMPYYGLPLGTPYEEVAFGFNRDVITGLLRERYGFDGVVCTDWGLLTDREIGDRKMEARAWGVEHLSSLQRTKKALDAGVDQFGGESSPELIIELVRTGQIAEARLDESIRRLLRDKFRLGLFDNPYVDPAGAERVVGNPEFRAAGELAQRRAIILLKNGSLRGEPALPVKGRPKLYVENVDPAVAQSYGDVVDSIEQADLAILRLKAPYQPRDGDFLERMFHAGDLDFKGEEKAHILDVLSKIPAVVDIYLDRPAVIPEIAEASAALLANFGAADAALLDVIFGRFSPSARLPFELPSSMDAVRRQKEDLPYDSENPLFPFGSGLSY